MNKLRVDNIVQMYTNGAIKPPNLAAVLAREIVEERKHSDELRHHNMEKLCYIETLWRRSLWKTLKDWWSWSAHRK